MHSMKNPESSVSLEFIETVEVAVNEADADDLRVEVRRSRRVRTGVKGGAASSAGRTGRSVTF
jgi:hypothetical protein